MNLRKLIGEQTFPVISTKARFSSFFEQAINTGWCTVELTNQRLGRWHLSLDIQWEIRRKDVFSWFDCLFLRSSRIDFFVSNLVLRAHHFPNHQKSLPRTLKVSFIVTLSSTGAAYNAAAFSASPSCSSPTFPQQQALDYTYGNYGQNPAYAAYYSAHAHAHAHPGYPPAYMSAAAAAAASSNNNALSTHSITAATAAYQMAHQLAPPSAGEVPFSYERD